MSRTLVAGLAYLMVLGCEDAPKPAPAKEEEPIRITPTKTDEAPKVTAEESAAKAALEQKSKEQAAVEANPLTPCCRALGKASFVERSADLAAAATACGEGITANKSKAETLPAIKKALGKAKLPSECN